MTIRRGWLSPEDRANLILGLDEVPIIPWLDMGGWRDPPSGWIDHQLVSLLWDCQPDGETIGILIDQLGLPGGRIAGRLRALQNRGIVVKLRGQALAKLREDSVRYSDYRRSELGASGWRLSAASLRKGGRTR